MAIGYYVEIPGVTQEEYDALFEKATGFTVGDGQILDGFISHTAGPTENGWFICDVVESQEVLDRFFAERFGPAAAALGAPPAEPRLFEVHNYMLTADR